MTAGGLPHSRWSFNDAGGRAGLPCISVSNTKAVAFETVNDESVLGFYNPCGVSKDVLSNGSDAYGKHWRLFGWTIGLKYELPKSDSYFIQCVKR